MELKRVSQEFKTNASIRFSSAYIERIKSNQLFVLIYGYDKLEKIKLTNKLNYFVYHIRINITSMKISIPIFQFNIIY